MTKLLPTLTLTLLSTAVSFAADFFPLQTGNLWVYREATTGQQFEISVGTPTQSNGQIYYSLRGFLPQRALVRVNEGNNLVFLDEEHLIEPVIAGFNPSRTAYSGSGRTCLSFATTLEQRVDYTGPTGHWQALAVDYQSYSCADAGELQELFVENIGMVRRVTQTIAGPRTFDLVYARVGKQVVAAGESGNFTVTALPAPDGASWQVTLRVSPDVSPLPISFPSGQEYDLRLRDESGQILWTWSADKAFILAFHSRILNGYTATVNVPVPPHAPELVPTYTLEAWLTTERSQPQFAATTTLRLAPKDNKIAAASWSVRWVR